MRRTGGTAERWEVIRVCALALVSPSEAQWYRQPPCYLSQFIPALSMNESLASEPLIAALLRTARMWCSPWMCTSKWGMDLIFVLNQWTTSLWNQQPHYITGKRQAHTLAHTHTHTHTPVGSSLTAARDSPPLFWFMGYGWLSVMLLLLLFACCALSLDVGSLDVYECVRKCAWVFISCGGGAAIDFQL